MAITPDLKDWEFEITNLCPVGACLTKYTFAYSKEVKKRPKDVKEIKARMLKLMTKDHNEGKHVGQA